MTDDEFLEMVKKQDPDAYFIEETVGGMKVLVTKLVGRDYYVLNTNYLHIEE